MGNYKLNQCRICNQQIDIRAWKCPNCHQRQNEILKIYVPIAFTLIIFMAMGWFSYQFWVHGSEAKKQENQTYLVINEFSDLLSSLKDAETGQRGFIITGNRKYLEPYNDSLKVVESYLSTLRVLTSDNPNQQRRLITIEPLIRARLIALDEIIKLRSAKGFQSASDRIKMDFGNKSMESIRKLVGEALVEERELLKVRSAKEKEDASLVLYAILFGGILSSLILITVYVVLWREYARRLIVESELIIDRNTLQEQNHQITSANEALRIEITERREAEEAMQHSEERYRTLFNTMNEGFCTIEMLFNVENHPIDYRFLEINPAFEAQTGLRNAQGKLMSELAPELEAHWFESFGKVALTGEPSHFENEAKALNRWYVVNACRVDGPDSRKVAILFNDITEARRAEAVLKNSNENLEKRVAERTEELAVNIDNLRVEIIERERAVETLREQEQMLIQQSRLAAMGEMIGNIAHQWRQPLNLLGLMSQQLLLYYDLGEFDRTFLAENVDKEMDLIQHMSKTIDDFRNYFKPDKERVEFRVKDAVTNTLSLLEGSLQNPPIRVEVVAKDDPILHGYPNEFAQVLLNLIINAKDVFSEREIVDPTLMITISSEDSCVLITVADNGGGIPEEIMDNIFAPYFTTKGLQGTGVGLFMSKSIIEKNMGGRLTVRNFANGAEFRIAI